ncbi:MAG: 50S ribosomal protein L28 [Holosporaceae bacterium]|jgi:large subunit ribosomal protein L28|nr:50S ribosomal protein L28 [Holosporaceae bacterium]
MARVCSLSGKKVMYGNNVSHANNKSRRRFMPNLQMVSFLSDALGFKIKARLCARTVSSVEKSGGIDRYLLNARNEVLSPRFRRLKKLLTNMSD